MLVVLTAACRVHPGGFDAVALAEFHDNCITSVSPACTPAGTVTPWAFVDVASGSTAEPMKKMAAVGAVDTCTC